MSSPVSEQVILIAEQSFIDNYCEVSIFVLYIYERVLTLNQEIQVVWRQKITGATVFYAILHLMTLLYTTVYLSSLFVESCQGGYVSFLLLNVATTIQWLVYSIIAAARVYAISGQHWLVPSIVFILFLPNMTLGLYECSQVIYTVAPPPVGCILYYDAPLILLNKNWWTRLIKISH